MRFLVFLLLLGACAGPQVALVPDTVVTSTEGAISGIVRDAVSGKPLSMVSVQADQGGKRIAHDVSDFDGHYRLGPLPPGRYDLSAKFTQARVQYKDIPVEKAIATNVQVSIEVGAPDGDTKENEAARFGSIQGVVLDGPGGSPFPGAVVSLTGGNLREVVMAMADAEGSFHFRGLTPGVYTVGTFYTLVKAGNVEVRKGNIVVRAGETSSVQMALDLRIH